eukprot:CAMPEP_0185583766 /NCGR_PEP_ID=MMETSP0434-20130131/27632_1 /TAXON_ID=626734 ORGANISM="Favella taraikaensis, Strain Fe Narragansett Bay" /NCGR_SAMPLE_ID=MMETSP0434 /ASSEMBLY_ACC=CAM_ASM_000379 /LENGTH=44 /DNA_ID= /DNA_START= /DNA_END= /DNA_ORIENTATION=
MSFQLAEVEKKMKQVGALDGRGDNEAIPAVVVAVTAYINDTTLN